MHSPPTAFINQTTHHGDAVEEEVALVEERGARQALRGEESGGVLGGAQVDGAALGEEHQAIEQRMKQRYHVEDQRSAQARAQAAKVEKRKMK